MNEVWEWDHYHMWQSWEHKLNIFHCVIQSHYYVQSAVVQNFPQGVGSIQIWYSWTINEPHLPKKGRSIYKRSFTAQDTFQPMSGLISCTGQEMWHPLASYKPLMEILFTCHNIIHRTTTCIVSHTTCICTATGMPFMPTNQIEEQFELCALIGYHRWKCHGCIFEYL